MPKLSLCFRHQYCHIPCSESTLAGQVPTSFLSFWTSSLLGRFYITILSTYSSQWSLDALVSPTILDSDIKSSNLLVLPYSSAPIFPLACISILLEIFLEVGLFVYTEPWTGTTAVPVSAITDLSCQIVLSDLSCLMAGRTSIGRRYHQVDRWLFEHTCRITRFWEHLEYPIRTKLNITYYYVKFPAKR